MRSAIHSFMQNMSNNQYGIVLTRGYVDWGCWRRFRERLAKIIFCCLYWSDKKGAELLFGHNSHNDGLSVDVQLYHIQSNKTTCWLSWKNIMISRARALKIIKTNKAMIHMLDVAMRSANFITHRTRILPTAKSP